MSKPHYPIDIDKLEKGNETTYLATHRAVNRNVTLGNTSDGAIRREVGFPMTLLSAVFEVAQFVLGIVGIYVGVKSIRSDTQKGRSQKSDEESHNKSKEDP
ncbi:hypothetical protein [Planktotalea sp.]|uniref:hypothetical protein n=1 Tax=Planktotalea sp. TaxID=2029877 RepID=UPI003F6C7D20